MDGYDSDDLSGMVSKITSGATEALGKIEMTGYASDNITSMTSTISDSTTNSLGDITMTGYDPNTDNLSSSVTTGNTFTDTTTPSNSSISISNKTSYTRSSSSFTLSLSAYDSNGVTAYCLSTSSSIPSRSSSCFISVSSASTFSKTISNVSIIGGSGWSYIYGWFKDSSGNVSLTFSDSIYCPTNGSCSSSVDNTAPSNPTNYTSLSRNGNVYLSWNNPNDSDFHLVKVYRTTSTNPSAYDLTLIYSGSSTHDTDYLLTNYTTYYFYIFAYDYSGNVSLGLYVSGTPYIPISSSDLLLLQGAEIYGQDGQYLGDITGQYNTNSIFNSYGTYGSNYSSKSIWNTYVNYGSSYGSNSAFNSYTTTPPIIYKNSVAVGYLTTNSYKTPRIDSRSLILYKNSFY